MRRSASTARLRALMTADTPGRDVRKRLAELGERLGFYVQAGDVAFGTEDAGSVVPDSLDVKVHARVPAVRYAAAAYHRFEHPNTLVASLAVACLPRCRC